MEQLRIAVVGAGLMGADHIVRINSRIVDAVVSAVIEPDQTRAEAALANASGATWFESLEAAIVADAMDAVLIATPGQFHEAAIEICLAAGLPILCEKPLTPDAESAARVLKLELATGKQLLQIGFMRRFDQGYLELRKLIASKNQGELLGLHCVHRNPSVPETYHNEMLVFDSLVHELDIVRFLTNSPITSVEIKHLKRNSLTPEKLVEPILALLETADGNLATVELNVSVQFGYQVRTEAVFEKGVAEIGRTQGLITAFDGNISTKEHDSFRTRFAAAYDSQIQSWVNATKLGKIDGPSAWDGYLAAAAVEAGLEALRTGHKVQVKYQAMPTEYKSN